MGNPVLKLLNLFLLALVITVLICMGLEYCGISVIYKNNKLNSIVKSDKIIEIPIEPLREFSGKSVYEIFSLRKDAIKTSPLFSSIKQYTMNQNVFKIEDGLPWIGAYESTCHGITENIGNGPSRNSFEILNPEILLNNITMDYNFEADGIPCSEVDYLYPNRLNYNSKTNTITAYVDVRNFRKKNGFYPYIALGDINAGDLGYNWVYSNPKDNINVKFTEKNNVTLEPMQTASYIHKGYACKLKGGCNNISPRISSYDFQILRENARVVFELWKNKPISKYQPADVIYRIVYE